MRQRDVIRGLASVALLAAAGCGGGGGNGDEPAPDVLWLAQKDIDFNVHLVEDTPFPF